jgi:hypothetical protein
MMSFDQCPSIQKENHTFPMVNFPPCRAFYSMLFLHFFLIFRQSGMFTSMPLTVPWHLYICFHLLVYLREGCILTIPLLFVFRARESARVESLHRAFYEPSHALRDEVSLVAFSTGMDAGCPCTILELEKSIDALFMR